MNFNAGTFSGAIFSLHIFRKSFAQRIYYIEIHLMLVIFRELNSNNLRPKKSSFSITVQKKKA